MERLGNPFFFVPTVFEELEELIRDRNLTIRGLCFYSLDPNLAAIEVDVSPYYGPYFFDPRSGRREQDFTIDDSTIETFEDPSEVATGGNKTFLCIVLYTQTIESSNYLDDESALDCDANCSRENGESSVVRRGRVPFKAVLSSGSDESGSILPKSIIPSLDVVIRYVKVSQIFEFGPGTPEKLD